jgi:hypothetical protein
MSQANAARQTMTNAQRLEAIEKLVDWQSQTIDVLVNYVQALIEERGLKKKTLELEEKIEDLRANRPTSV